MILYKTIKKEGTAEQVIDKSRFIAHVKPVSTKEEADAFIKEIKTKHKSATHNVPAMVVGDKFQIQWASDDGEPQGTSGAPIVQMLVNEGITNVAVVITRYFGGVKLGTGGLVRAYTSSAKLGVLAGEIGEIKELITIKIKMEYSYLTKFQSLSRDNYFKIGEIIYEDLVTINFMMDPERGDEFNELVSNITGGKATIIEETVGNVFS